MVNIWNAAEWTYQQTKTMDIKNENQKQALIKVWGRFNTTRRSFMMLKEHQGMIIEKCCKLLGTDPNRVLGPPKTDKLSASRLSLAIFKSYKSSLMVREMAGHYSSISEPDEWKVGTSSAVTFNPSLIITALRTVRILGINSTAQYAPEKLLDTVTPVPEEFLLTELWYCKTLGRGRIFQGILMRIQSTVVYANMAMVHRLCPATALAPINALQSDGTGTLHSEKAAISLMQTTQWIYERGMKELQDAAVEYFHDIPVQIGTWDWSETW